MAEPSNTNNAVQKPAGLVILFLLYVTLHVLIKILAFDDYFLGNDSPTFIEPAISLAQNFRFGDMIWRTPIYPIFLAIHYIFFGAQDWLTAATYTQIIFSAVAVAMLLEILVREGGKRAHYGIFGFVMLIYPALYYYENKILSESLSFFWVSWTAWTLWRFTRQFSIKDALLLSLAVGLAPLLRPEYVVIPVVLIFYFTVLSISKKVAFGSQMVASMLTISILPTLLWIVRNYIVFSYIGLTAGAGGALIFHTYTYIEAGKTEYNAPAVNRVTEALKREYIPNAVFVAAPRDGPVEERIRYWQQVSDATVRAVLARPLSYLASAGHAVISMTYPALGRKQIESFFGFGGLAFRIYQVIHFLVFGLVSIAVFVALVMAISRLRRSVLSEIYILSLFGVIFADYLLTCLIIDGPNNRYRMPFDGAILLLGLLASLRISRAREHGRPV